MSISLKPIREQVMVITGASSGIGLKTAQLAAERGARVVLVSRNEDALKNVTDEIKSKGGQAIYAVADVANPPEIETVANMAIAAFGTIDTWMNIAGVGIWGYSQEVPIEEARKLFDTNFWGLVNGTRTAIRLLSDKGGAIINVGSVASEHAIPLQSFYSASKHAVKAYTDAVRMEIHKQGLPVSLTLVKPSSIDTPITDHARNYLEKGAPRLVPPAYSTDLAAKSILECAEVPRRELTIGGAGMVMELMDRVLPSLLDKFLELTAFNQQRRSDRPTGQAHALYHPVGDEGHAYGTHDGYVARTSLSTTASLHPIQALMGAVLIGGIGYLAWQESKRASQGRFDKSRSDDLVEVGTYRGATPQPTP